MELLGEEVGQLWGRRQLYIVGETIQPLPPKQPHTERYYHLGRAVLPLTSGTTTPSQRYCRADEGCRVLAPERYYRGSIGGTTAWSGTTAPTAATSTLKPDTKNRVENRGGSSPEPLQYYGRRPQAVLPLGEWYYRWGAVLPLWERYYRLGASVVLPLWIAVLPLGQNKAYLGEKGSSNEAERNIGCDKDVYVLIPP